MAERTPGVAGTEDTIDSAAPREPSHLVLGIAESATIATPPGAIPSPTPAPAANASVRRDADYPVLQPVAAEHYVVAGTMAQGGMGRILRARDRRLGRDVALKELRVSSPHLAARLEREARITARLQHPAIVGVHEAGVWPTGAPFYAMELVAGRALDEVLREVETLRDRMALVPHALAVADALAYAHAQGVIHRDLKPSNVLVGDFGETVVIDWGLAKDLRSSADDVATPIPTPHPLESGETAIGAVVGTPAYMPPEQARGEKVDERADVYAIGALIFQTLSGAPPFVGKSADEVLEKVLGRPAPALATAVPGVPPDLAAIVDKAMAHEPAARYPSARELAEDLRAFQTGRLVAAHRYTTRQRLRRFLRRYRLAVSIAGVALVLLAALATWSIVRIVRERDAALAARREADDQRALAETRRKRADTLRAAAEDLVGFMLGDLQPQLARVGRLDVMKGVGTKVDGYYRTLAGAAEDLDDAARARRATALGVLGDVLDIGGDVAGARRSYQAAIALDDALPGPAAAVAGARARTGLGLEQQLEGDLDRAVATIDAARARLDALPAGTAGRDLALAVAYRRLGTIAFMRDKSDDAGALLAKALDHATAAGDGADPQKEAAKIDDRLGDLRGLRGDYAGALAAARAGLAIREQLAARDPGDLEVAGTLPVSWDKVYNAAVAVGDRATAAHAADAGIAAAEPLVARDPANTEWARSLEIAYTRPAELAYDADDFAGAAKAAHRAVEIARQLAVRAVGDLDAQLDLAKMLAREAHYLASADDVDHAEPLVRDAIAITEAIVARAPGNADYTALLDSLHQDLGDVFSQRDDFADAAVEYRRLLTAREQAFAADPRNPTLESDLADIRMVLGDTLTQVPGHIDEGLALFQQGLDTWRAMRDAGRLSADAASLISDREKHFAAAQKRRH